MEYAGLTGIAMALNGAKSRRKVKTGRPSDGWGACTWEGAREDALRLGRNLTFREKVIWLEQAARLSVALKNGRRKVTSEGR